MKTLEDIGPEPAYRPGDRIQLRYTEDGIAATIEHATRKTSWDVWEYRIRFDNPTRTVVRATCLRPLGPSTTAETKNPETKKEQTKMNPIEIKTVTLVNGTEAKNYSAGDRSRLLACVEQEVKRLEGLEFKTQETEDEIAALRASAVAAIAEFDKEYAERKAAERKAAAK